MIDISERAQKHFARLLAQQGIENLGIRVRVTAAGTPAANCELEFCEPDDLVGNEQRMDCPGFTLHVDHDSAAWMEGSTIDFEPTTTGGQLNIRAPRIKGVVPGADAGLVARVRYVLDAEVNPKLAAHGGQVSLTDIVARELRTRCDLIVYASASPYAAGKPQLRRRLRGMCRCRRTSVPGWRRPPPPLQRWLCCGLLAA